MNKDIKQRIEMINRGEIPKGYKKTKIGSIPGDWDIKQLKSVAKVIDGDRSSNYPSERDIVDSGVLFLSTKNIIGSRIDFNEKRFITPEKFESLRKGKLKQKDLIITMRGSIGSVAQFRSDKYETAFINAQMSIIRPADIYSDFLWIALNSNFVQKHIKNISSGSAQPQLTKKDVENFLVILPSEMEQQKIAEILSTWDKAIELKEKLIEEKKKQKKGLMQLLLTGKKRLPGFEGEWKKYQIKDLLDYEQPWPYIANNVLDYSPGRIPVLTANKSFVLGSTDENEGIYTNLPVIIFDDFTTDKKYVDFPFKVKSSAVKILRAKDNKCNVKFMFELMQFMHVSQGDHKRHYISEYQHKVVYVPNHIEQKAISEISIVYDKEIQLLEQELEALKLQKKGLMQLLLTGIVRVKI